MKLTFRVPITATALLMIFGLLLAGCGATGPQAGGPKLAPVSSLPQQMQEGAIAVRTAYQFAVANPSALANVPCYCGCGAVGHTSNLACYIKQFGADGELVFDDHALGCSICVDIATDVMKMTGEGLTSAEIRQQVVTTYSKFGPANQE